tara:strand:- start:353 stop:1348 length:996 start_codon:yes stop_codon:yes gene_type:complete
MKLISIKVENDYDIIKNNLNKYTDINIDDYLVLYEEKSEIIIEDVNSALLNSLRQMAYRYDYMFYLDCEINSIYMDLQFNKNEGLFNKTDICNRINSIIINNKNEDLLSDFIDCNIGNINKKINYNDNIINYLKSNDINFNDENLIQIDKEIRIFRIPFTNGNFNIDNIILKKNYTYIDNRYCNISSFSIIPLDSNSNNIIDINIEPKKFKILISGNGSLPVDMLIPRFINILFIKLKQDYIIENNYILFVQSGIYLENLLIDYSYNNNINIICKIVEDNVYCYNIDETDLLKILKIINNDIINLLSVILKINFDDAKINLNNNKYAKYLL